MCFWEVHADAIFKEHSFIPSHVLREHETKEKGKQIGLHQNLKCLCIKGHNQENEKIKRGKYLQTFYLIRV